VRAGGHGAALSAGAIKLSAAQVLTLPLPERPWDDAAAALAAGDVDGCAEAMDAAYGTDLFDWWHERYAGAAVRRRVEGAPIVQRSE
jgi:hypothetical protein